MKTGDLITSYLSNEMTPEQERQFLLSVAASDSLRLALKSHVMLDQIVTRQTQHVHVPNALRENIFAQMSASMGSSAGTVASGVKNPGILARFGRGAMMALLTVSGFAAGYFIHPQAVPDQSSSIQQPAVRHVEGGGLPSDSPAPVQGSVTTQVPTKPASEPTTESASATMTASGQSASATPVQRVRPAGISAGIAARNTRPTVSSSTSVVSSEAAVPVQNKPASASQSGANPLDLPATVPHVAAGEGKSVKPSTDAAKNPSGIGVDPTIRKSDGSRQTTVKQEDPK